MGSQSRLWTMIKNMNYQQANLTFQQGAFKNLSCQNQLYNLFPMLYSFILQNFSFIIQKLQFCAGVCRKKMQKLMIQKKSQQTKSQLCQEYPSYNVHYSHDQYLLSRNNLSPQEWKNKMIDLTYHQITASTNLDDQFLNFIQNQNQIKQQYDYDQIKKQLEQKQGTNGSKLVDAVIQQQANSLHSHQLTQEEQPQLIQFSPKKRQNQNDQRTLNRQFVATIKKYYKEFSKEQLQNLFSLTKLDFVVYFYVKIQKQKPDQLDSVCQDFIENLKKFREDPLNAKTQKLINLSYRYERATKFLNNNDDEEETITKSIKIIYDYDNMNRKKKFEAEDAIKSVLKFRKKN